jgi:cobalt-zinc-cadmium resistance protein CzcA
MIERIIHFSIKNKFIVGLFVLALIGWGTYSLTRLPIDAIPDITNNQVQIISVAPSLATQEVESFITAPIEVAVANIPDIIERFNNLDGEITIIDTINENTSFFVSGVSNLYLSYNNINNEFACRLVTKTLTTSVLFSKTKLFI